MVVDNTNDLLKGLFKVLETDSVNAESACLCLVNLSAKENGLNKIISFLNSDTAANNSVYFHSIILRVYVVVNLEFIVRN